MNPTAIQLALLGSRRSWGRPLGVVLGIAVGVVLFLTLWGAATGLDRRDNRTAWLHLDYFAGDIASGPLDSGQALVADTNDYFRNAVITRRDIAVSADTTLTMPWTAPFPAAGEYYASPALARLIASTPDDELGDRYGTSIGMIPTSALAGPDALVVVVGQSEATMQSRQGTMVMRDLSGTRTQDNLVYRSVIIVGGIAMFLPVLIFVAIVTELGAVQRMERLSTLRLNGAGARNVVAIAAIEMTVLSFLGSLLGIIAWWILRPVGAAFSIDGTRFFVSDLSVSSSVIIIAVCFTVIGSTLTAAWRISRA
ncbi:MAG TPA: hypothetical protein PK819_09325, partial [Thermomicrobiales bacterium]|nr:hypothetical protein [Thermomicrobiales bacterium]